MVKRVLSETESSSNQGHGANVEEYESEVLRLRQELELTSSALHRAQEQVRNYGMQLELFDKESME